MLNAQTNTNEMIEEVLHNAQKVAVVGYSNKPHRAGHYVPAYLQQQGYQIIPVNPLESEGLGEKAYPSLNDVPDPIDLVLIFRKAEDVPEVVEQAIEVNAKCVWMQLGIIHEPAAAAAEQAGLGVVMDKCMLVEHRNRGVMGAGDRE